MESRAQRRLRQKLSNNAQSLPINDITAAIASAPVAHGSRRKRSRLTLIAGVACLVAVFTIIGGLFIQKHATSRSMTNTTASDEMIENLEYQTVLPDGKTITQLGGWRKVSPPKGKPVYAYGDSIDEIPINVSQQPLPDSFIGQSERQLAELAKSYSATTELDAGTTRAYLGTSSKGPQSVLLTKNNLLILIKSEDKIPNASWIKYLKALN